MKNFYSLLVASAVAVSASASGLQEVDFVTPLLPRNVKNIEVPAFPNQVSLAPVNKNFRGLRKADSNPSLEGFWTMYLGDFYDEINSEFGVIPVNYQTTLEDGLLTFTPLAEDDRFQPFKAVYNAEDQTITLNKMMLSLMDGLYLFQVPYYYDQKQQDLVDVASIVGQYDPEMGSITFELDYGLTWGLYKNALGTDLEGDVAIFDINSGYQFNATEALEGDWTPIGNVAFMDGWLVPAMGLNPAQNIYDVPFEQNDQNPFRYRLVNPYLYGPVAQYNGSEGGYIVFDISDPDHVLFLPTDAGFVNYVIGGLPGGITTFYCYNALGYEVVNQPMVSLEEIIALYDYIPFTTYKDNTVTLSFISGEGDTAYDANFGYQAAPYGGNFWNGVNMSASITFPSWFDAQVGAIEVDESNAPVEYFNINGVRIQNPQPGQIVIKRQGSKVVKEIRR